MCAVNEIVCVLALVHPSKSIGDHVVLNCLGGDGEVVMRYLGEEEVVGYVSI